jgi:Na+-transporting NADH:ubiquinone oxidoreductase subunit NqrD
MPPSLLHHEQMPVNISAVLVTKTIQTFVVDQLQIVFLTNTQHVFLSMCKSTRRGQLPSPVRFRLIQAVPFHVMTRKGFMAEYEDVCG